MYDSYHAVVQNRTFELNNQHVDVAKKPDPKPKKKKTIYLFNFRIIFGTGGFKGGI
jgi:hypothetical protein